MIKINMRVETPRFSSQLTFSFRFKMTTSWHEETVRPKDQPNQPHPPGPLFPLPELLTPIPISWQVLVLLPNAKSLDLDSSTFICFLSK